MTKRKKNLSTAKATQPSQVVRTGSNNCAASGLGALPPPDPRPARILRAVALCLLLVVVGSRMLFTESLSPPWTIIAGVALDEAGQPIPWQGPTPADSIAVFSLILLAALLWAIAQAIAPRPIVGRWPMLFLAAFAVAAMISTLAASNKAAARDHALLFGGVLLTFWLMLQLLTGRRARQLAVAVVLTAAVIFAAQAAWQHFVGNAQVVDRWLDGQREHFFAEQNWRPDEPRARQYEERLLSAEAKGFAVNSNIAAALLIVTMLAGAGWAVQKFAGPRVQFKLLFATLAAAGAAALLVCLLLTGSRGGIAAGLFALLLFASIGSARRWASRHRKALIVLAAIAVAAATVGVIVWTATMEQPPPDSVWYRSGPARSMLYRWHYWIGAQRAWLDAPLTGLGGGNFGNAYIRHKPSVALEDVSDPHNFTIAALVEYGPLGAAALLGMIGWVLLTLLAPRSPQISPAAPQQSQPPVMPMLATVVAVGLGIAGLRFWLQWPGYGDAATNMVIAFTAPIILLIMLLSRDRVDWPDDLGENWIRFGIGCGLVGFLLACTIDFGMSQAGSGTAFWVLAAVAGAGRAAAGRAARPALWAMRLAWVAMSGALLIGLVAVLTMAYAPVRSAERLMWAAANDGPLSAVTVNVEAAPGTRRSISAVVYDESFLARSLAADTVQPAAPGFLAQRLLSELHKEQFANGWPVTMRQVVRLLEEAHRRDPCDAFTALRLGAARLQLGLRDEWERNAALAVLASAVWRAPHSVSAWRQYGEMLLLAGLPSEAANAFARALAVDNTIAEHDASGLFALPDAQREELEKLRDHAAGATTCPQQ